MPGYFVIDFCFMVQININNPSLQRKIMRSNTTTDRNRPDDSFKWNDVDFLKPTLEQGTYAWLGKKWQKATFKKYPKRGGGSDFFVYPSVLEIMVGI